MARLGELAPLVSPDEYLGGLLDFSGELNRLAVAAATRRDRAAVAAAAEVVEQLVERLLPLGLRGGGLAKKLAPLEATRGKLAHTLYELSLSEGGLFAGLAAGGGGEAEGGGGAGGDPGEGNEY